MPEQPGTLAEALIRLQATLPRITKTAEAQYGKYADLASIHDAVLPLLAEHGLAWVCLPTMWTDQFVLQYELIHAASTESVKGWYPLPQSGGPQVIGSAITYARRYTLTAVLGIAPVGEDDDGKAAQASYEERVEAGRMSREQMREHGQLERDVKSSPRKAERVSGPAPDNADWETGPPEDAPGSITDVQGRRLQALFRKVGAHSHGDRMALAMSVLNLPELGNSADLSYAQAEELARKLENELRRPPDARLHRLHRVLRYLRQGLG